VVSPPLSAARRSRGPSLKRLVFLWECLADVPNLEGHLGDPRTVLADRATALGCDGIALADTPCPRVRRAAESLAAVLPLEVRAWPAFCDASRVADLGRFSRYWQKVSRSALQPTPA